MSYVLPPELYLITSFSEDTLIMRICEKSNQNTFSLLMFSAYLLHTLVLIIFRQVQYYETFNHK